ncbi:MAG: peptide chain release factor N(5)-glutamine methyltransferase, partial [Myxococcota bacterium]
MNASDRWTILKTLEWTQGYFAEKGIDTPRLDAEIILAHVLNTQRVMLYARFDQPLQATELKTIKALVARRARHEPIAHLVGRREFWSLDLCVGPDCLIPRPDSETIVEVALKLNEGRQVQSVVDVGTGSGCLALALAQEWPQATVFALEASAEARAIAMQNAEQTGLAERVQVISSDLLSNLPTAAQPVDVLVANLPYIPTADIETLMPDVRFFEPRIALDGGDDGLTLYRRLIDALATVMAPGGIVVFEAGPDQVEALAELLGKAGLTDVE